MATLLMMRSRVADSINRTDLSTQIDQAINDAIAYYAQRENFWFNETSATFNTIANQESYGIADGLPDDIGEINLLTLTLSTTNIQTLTKRTFDWIKFVNTGVAKGQPTDYAWYQNKLFFYLIPNQAQTMTIYYNKIYDPLVNDADTNDYSTYAGKLIVQRAICDICDNIVKDYACSDRAKVYELDELSALREQSNNFTMMPSIIQSTDF